MIALITTTRRRSLHTEPSGYIYSLDLDENKVLRRSYNIEPPHREADKNVRGGLRGSKGIAVRNDQIALSNYSAVFRFDPDWNYLGGITHPSCAGIHDILFQGDTIWLTGSRADLLMQFDLSGNLLRYFYMRQPSPANEALNWKPPIQLQSEGILDGQIDFRDPRTHDDSFDSAHVNSICILPDGEIFVSLGFILAREYNTLLQIKKWLIERGVWLKFLNLNRKMRGFLWLKDAPSDLVFHPTKSRAAVMRVSFNGAHSLCLAFSDIIVPSHSLLRLVDDTVIYLNTSTGEVVNFEPYEGKILSETKVTDGFLRGVTALSDNLLIMGSRGELIKFDRERKAVTERITISDDPSEAIYDIKILPPHYSLPPVNFIVPQYTDLHKDHEIAMSDMR